MKVTEKGLKRVDMVVALNRRVMLSGVELSIGEHVAGTEKTQEMRHIGTKPCECGWLRCATCPIFEQYTSYTPIFKTHALTTNQLIELHRWMVKQATGQAMIIVGDQTGIAGGSGKIKLGENMASLKWRMPNKRTFLGEAETGFSSGDKEVKKIGEGHASAEA